MSHGTVRNMSCVYDALAITSAGKTFPDLLQDGFLDESTGAIVAETSTNNYRIALRKYQQYKAHQQIAPRQKSLYRQF